MKLFQAVLVAAAAISVVSATANAAEYRPHEVIVKYKEGARRNRQTIQFIYDSVHVVKVKRFGQLRHLEHLILDPSIEVDQAIVELEKSSYVEYAEPNFVVHALDDPTTPETENSTDPSDGGIPCIPGIELPGCEPMPCIIPNFPPGCKDGDDENTPAPPSPTPPPNTRPPVAAKPNEPATGDDPDIASTYGMSKIGASEAWEKGHRGSQNMVVAVIDTGVDYNHDQLSYNMWRNPNPDTKTNDVVGFDFVHNDGLPYDDHAHGTHCAGVIGAVGNDGKGISGVNQRVSIMALKFLGPDGSGDEVGAIRAIEYAVSHGAKVLSNSWGGSGSGAEVKALKDAVLFAQSKGVLFVAAAGNEGSDNDKMPQFPAGFNTVNMLAVAATDAKDKLAYFSNIGAKSVHVGAPGVDVYSTTPGNKYQRMSGTSMACPHAAGATALVWSENPKLSFSEVKARIMSTVDKVPSLAGKTITGGRINVMRALEGR